MPAGKQTTAERWQAGAWNCQQYQAADQANQHYGAQKWQDDVPMNQQRAMVRQRQIEQQIVNDEWALALSHEDLRQLQHENWLLQEVEAKAAEAALAAAAPAQWGQDDWGQQPSLMQQQAAWQDAQWGSPAMEQQVPNPSYGIGSPPGEIDKAMSLGCQD